MPYQFPGYPPFAERALAELGNPPIRPDKIGSDHVVRECQSLIAQACNPGLKPEQVDGILAAAEALANTLAVCHRAAVLMLEDARTNLLPAPEPETIPEDVRVISGTVSVEGPIGTDADTSQSSRKRSR